ncbi:PREDICTED: putative ribonuclease H protein At1g65750-like [Fragaria vesca subsp. vesca]
MCGSPLTNDLGKYLGMPLIHSRVNKHTYDGIFDQVQSRLSSWKSKVLSMAGRLTLIQSVSSAIPNYAMQTAKFPVSLCENLDKLNRNFLWGDTEIKKKVHLVNWDVVCQPKQLGDIGIKKTEDMNQAMLAKISWRMFQCDKGLWASMFAEKYLKNCCLFDDNYEVAVDCSSTWRGIIFGAKLLRSNLKWRLGDGKSIKFWHDYWFPAGPLINFALPSAFINHAATVCDFWIEDGWDVHKLLDVVPFEIVNKIVNVPIDFGVSGSDTLIWGATANGKFFVKSAYNSLFDMSAPLNPQWNYIWRMKIPPKLKTFLWTFLHKKLLTNMQRVTRGFTASALCPICQSADESFLHLFRDCPRSVLIWNAFVKPGSISQSFSLDWNGWIQAQLHCHSFTSNNIRWCDLFVFIC